MKPERLAKGDTIGIISPAYWIEENILGKAVTFLEEKGFHIKIGSAAYRRNNPFAGTIEERVNELENMFSDDSVKAIFCGRGGYGSVKVAEKLNYDLISGHPKIFVGYSDITALLITLHKFTGLTTFHGPMMVSFKEKTDPFSWSHLMKVLSGEKVVTDSFPEDLKPIILNSGRAEGKLTGGNLTILTNLLGTPQDVDTSGKVLFLEDVDERYYSIDRMLNHLKRAGKLDEISGLIIGEMINIGDEEIPFGKSIDEIVMDNCGDLNIPIVSNFPCGHGQHQLTMPISIDVRLDSRDDNVQFTFLESAVMV